MILAQFSAKLVNRLRLFRARRMHKTVRFKVGDLQEFYTAMNAANVPYCVLRWADDVPYQKFEDSGYTHDIDHLIGRNAISDICRMASEQPGSVKCDFYSIDGERGSAYASMPYLTPALAAGVLQRRVRKDYPFFVPSLTDEFFSFAYHLVYHKGAECGVPTGIAGITTNAAPVRDYLAELVRLSTRAHVSLGSNITLLSIHEFLRQHGWNMPHDLMVRWPRKHAVLRALIKHDQAVIQPLVDQVSNIYVFVLRSQSRIPQHLEIAVKILSTRFDILDTRILNENEIASLARLTRGGNWYEKGHIEPILPTDIIVCRTQKSCGPLPNGMSAEKIAKRYPHVSNTDVLIKREVRAALRKTQDFSKSHTYVHATDNPTETAETLHAVMGGEVKNYLTTLRNK